MAQTEPNPNQLSRTEAATMQSPNMETPTLFYFENASVTGPLLADAAYTLV